MAVSLEGGQATASGAALEAPADLSTLLETTRVALLRRYGQQPLDTLTRTESRTDSVPSRGG